nr:MAG TPA: Vpu protein [Caudoviricetes sp.]
MTMRDYFSFILLVLGAALVVAPVIYCIAVKVIDYKQQKRYELIRKISEIAELASNILKSNPDKSEDQH